jgi:MarR family transcriptional regulator, negative regulator of the multidrug operon emrRAB
MPLSQLSRVEENIRGLSRRVPALPANEALLLRAIVILGRDINALLERGLKPAGLSEAEFRLLMALFSHGGHAAAGEVCGALAQSPANLTRISDTLVERGYISRSPDTLDRRRMLLTLEPAGEELLQSLLPHIGADIAAVFASFSTADKQQLLGHLKLLMGGIDALGANA